MAGTFIVPAEAAGQRLDAWLTRQLEGVSRERVQLLLEQQKIRLDGQSPRASYRLRGGETVEVLGDPVRPPLKAFAEDIPLRVVYEDDALSVIDKPAGMMVHAGAGATEAGTLVNALLHRYGTLSSTGGELRPGIVHRLDKQTSGLIVVARNDAVHARLAEMFSRREMRKMYIALVHGHLRQDSGTVNAPVARDLLRRTRMTTRREAGARSAVSHYTVERRITSPWGKFTLVRVRIETGRTHQIRVHMASIGHPVVGDTLYGAPAQISHEKGGSQLSLPRNFLHAAELEFTHPVTRKQLHLEAPLPEELRACLGTLEAGASYESQPSEQNPATKKRRTTKR
ncbi:MAG TPA: RluA family pseudouridine synthase [Acidobacteriaceae bacterium]|nr:RluA family pseudouridine synthase [Acidobacteriaceae bacterium]